MSGLHMLKLCVGADTVDQHRGWIAQRMADRQAQGLDPRPRHTTRMWPRRAEELLDGGSLYWVVRGQIASRQRIEDLIEVTGEDGIRRCQIVLNPEVVAVEHRPRRPFQGWRYLSAEDAPPDLRGTGFEAHELPYRLAEALDGLGVIAR